LGVTLSSHVMWSSTNASQLETAPISVHAFTRESSETKLLADERSTKRTLQTTLKPVPNDLDDTTHARLDTLVLKTCKEPVETIRDASFLLATIVWNSEGRFNQKYSYNAEARVLIEEHLELLGILKEAWNNGTFKQILNLSVPFSC
jgi:hypothetical protein